MKVVVAFAAREGKHAPQRNVDRRSGLLSCEQRQRDRLPPRTSSCVARSSVWLVEPSEIDAVIVPSQSNRFGGEFDDLPQWGCAADVIDTPVVLAAVPFDHTQVRQALKLLDNVASRGGAEQRDLPLEEAVFPGLGYPRSDRQSAPAPEEAVADKFAVDLAPPCI